MTKEEIIENVMKPIKEAGYEVYFVGGCVRDELLGKEPKDYDLSTNATPEQLHKIFHNFSNISKNAEDFGVTIPVIYYSRPNKDTFKEAIEIATFRKDISKGRHPKIEFSKILKEDASRRDFTINAMYEDMNGNIIDPFNGKKDIEQKALRFVGNPKDRLTEDPLRAFRFVRFLAKTGFTAAYDTMEIENACRELDFSEVSKERMLKEFKQILAGEFFNYRTEAFNFAYYTRVFEVVGLLDIFTKMDMVEQSWRWHAEGSVFENKNGGSFLVMDRDVNLTKTKPIEHGSVLAHTFLTLDAMYHIIWNKEEFPRELSIEFNEDKKFLLMLGAILHDIGKCYCEHQGKKTNTFIFEGNTYKEEIDKVSEHPKTGLLPAEIFCKSLKLSNDETNFICSIVAKHMEAHQLLQHKHLHKIWPFVQHKYFKEIMLIALADERGSIKLEGFDENGSVRETLDNEKIIYCMNHKMPNPVLTGKDLINFGLSPSPRFAKILEIAYNFQIDQGKTDKKELFKLSKNAGK